MLRLFFLKVLSLVWELWSLISLIGIWPRYIEPRLLSITRKKLVFSKGDADLEGVKIVHFTDLHFSSKSSCRFLKKISRKIKAFSPDLIVFTGDFVCYSILQQSERFKAFFHSFEAPLGCYYVYGNHDYSEYVTSQKGERVTLSYEEAQSPLLVKLAQRIGLCKSPTGQKVESKNIVTHPSIHSLLSEAGWECIEDRTIQVQKGKGVFNLCGMGDLWSGRFQPHKSFENYNQNLPGIILSHNPETFDELLKWPGDLVLSGHTHGGQVNLPFFQRLFVKSGPLVYRSGSFRLSKKELFTSRGVGSPITFRWFSFPELVFFTIGGIQ